MRFLILFFLLSGASCSQTNCRPDRSGLAKPDGAAAAAELPQREVPVYERVRVYKADGSLQCGQGKKTAISAVAKQLDGIKIFSQSKRNDGMMRIQKCGAETGDAHVFEIAKDQLPEAIGRGFKQWTFESE